MLLSQSFLLTTIFSIGEIAPAKYRGRMIAFSNCSVTFGQVSKGTQLIFET